MLLRFEGALVQRSGCVVCEDDLYSDDTLVTFMLWMCR